MNSQIKVLATSRTVATITNAESVVSDAFEIIADRSADKFFNLLDTLATPRRGCIGGKFDRITSTELDEIRATGADFKKIDRFCSTLLVLVAGKSEPFVNADDYNDLVDVAELVRRVVG